jgi:hypothetical protein
VEELLDRVDTDLKDIWGALAKSAVSGVCALACSWQGLTVGPMEGRGDAYNVLK